MDRLRRQHPVVLISIVVTAIAAFLPWATFLGISVSGIQGDGVVTLILAGVGFALALAWPSGWIGQLVLGCVVALIAMLDMNGLSAIGLYLTLFAGAAWAVGAVLTHRRISVPAPPSEVQDTTL